jgi:hypothetical protein
MSGAADVPRKEWGCEEEQKEELYEGPEATGVRD